ncbi:MAG: FAD-binding protein [Coriobacteriales bacterium]|nr:FAD-binding protein [Coriobacteriales bacterium]
MENTRNSAIVTRRGFVEGASLGLIGASALYSVQIATALADEPAAGPGIGEASAKGYAGDVTVSLTVADGKVTDIAYDGFAETPEKGGKALEKLAAAVLETGSVDVDAVAGATITSSAFLAAASSAYGIAMYGEELPRLKMKPGVYSASAKSGYWRIIDLPVTVTVNEDAILKIEVPDDRFAHGDTEVILESAKERFFPRVIENQSINIDAVTGATQTCAGVRDAVRHCVMQAFEANGVDAAAAGKFDARVDLKTQAGEVEELEKDILVIGLGNGGVIALLNACEEIQKRNGKKLVSVLAIDRAGKIGGKSALTHEAFAVNPPEYMKEYNNGEDYLDKEELRRRWMRFVTEDDQCLARQDCVDIMVDETGLTVDWLYSHGWRYGTVANGAGSVLTGGRGSFNTLCTSRADPGTYEDRRKYVNRYLNQLIDEAVSQGADVMLETEAFDFILDGDKVVGVKARNVVTGKEYDIKTKAIIMGTGGFSKNYALMQTLPNERFRGLYKTVGTGCDTGLMIEAALNIGAGTFNADMSPIFMHCGLDHWLSYYPINEYDNVLQNRTGRKNVWTLNNIPLGCAYDGMAVAIAHDCKRFMDESQYESFSQDIDIDSFAHWNGGMSYFVIVSEEVLAPIVETGFNWTTWDGYNTQGNIPKDMPVPEVYEGLDLTVAEGMAWKADTIADLAEQIGLDPAQVEATIDAYNAMVEKGVDEEFGKNPDMLVKIATPPFYAIQIFNAAFGSAAGLDVDAQLRVLKEDHETPIDGLYAIGLDSMGVIQNPHRHYVGFGGVAQGWYQTGGRLAGAYAAAYVGDTYGYAEISPALSEIPAGF